ncbi:ABC transporter ATP-binding protein [Roseomonas sp. CECT 9278]|uniref:oligopeptide/dipeptide ABC transporter ATP-binding protein n=1 Tax=Roseomonas sp. CECT 9278 TaxID=2845823 RepID=UPI001E3DE5F3|nr:ABC transporter ATP-binding protein [Roseomonas sp. CECT 9278]CAH0202583.1 Oligopeptide transport ATP-binding protein OppD [Roseomonas sp. CECT 9278]
MPEILGATDLVVELGAGRGLLRRRAGVRAVDGVDISVAEGETFGIVGESGCGKTTLARALLGLQRESAGEIRLEGRAVSGLHPRAARRVRDAVQYVHQDPGAALDPWWRVGATLAEGLAIHGLTDRAEQRARIAETLAAVGLDAAMADRYPHELSGGQQRRIGLARILLLRPKVVILDEPTAGLDLSVQAAVLRLLRDLRTRFGLTYVFISHDLSVVRRVCDRVAVMYLGRVVEHGSAATLFAEPRHPYTRALIAAAPHLDGRESGPSLPGDPPSLRAVPPGCRFHPRCAAAAAGCAQRDPVLEEAGADHAVACLRWRDLDAA